MSFYVFFLECLNDKKIIISRLFFRIKLTTICTDITNFQRIFLDQFKRSFLTLDRYKSSKVTFICLLIKQDFKKSNKYANNNPDKTYEN